MLDEDAIAGEMEPVTLSVVLLRVQLVRFLGVVGRVLFGQVVVVIFLINLLVLPVMFLVLGNMMSAQEFWKFLLGRVLEVLMNSSLRMIFYGTPLWVFLAWRNECARHRKSVPSPVVSAR